MNSLPVFDYTTWQTDPYECSCLDLVLAVDWKTYHPAMYKNNENYFFRQFLQDIFHIVKANWSIMMTNYDVVLMLFDSSKHFEIFQKKWILQSKPIKQNPIQSGGGSMIPVAVIELTKCYDSLTYLEKSFSVQQTSCTSTEQKQTRFCSFLVVTRYD